MLPSQAPGESDTIAVYCATRDRAGAIATLLPSRAGPSHPPTPTPCGLAPTSTAGMLLAAERGDQGPSAVTPSSSPSKRLDNSDH